MQVTGWKNQGGAPTEPSGYGLSVTKTDRRHFDRSWSDVIIELENDGVAIARLNETFWSTCPELRSADIGRWLLELGVAPWGTRAPPRIALTQVEGNRFAARVIQRRLPRGIT